MWKDGKPVPFDPYTDKTPAEGELLVTTQVDGIPLKTAFQILWENASARSLDEWAQLAGITARDIEELAREFTSHGKRAVADIHRGVSQHTNGFYQVFAWYTLSTPLSRPT